jgi:nucleotide-binding universal stress UspA family protein
LREVLDATFYIVRSGCFWCHLPHNFPPRRRVYHYFRRFRLGGTWEWVHAALRERVRVRLGIKMLLDRTWAKGLLRSPGCYSVSFLVGEMRGDLTDGIIRFAKRFVQTVSRERNEMSIFPTKILLATDSSREAELATQTAVDLARMSDSELHVVYVADDPSIALLYPEATDPEGVEMTDPNLQEDLQRRSEQRGRELLDAEVERVHSAGGTVAQAHLTMGEAGREIVHLAEDLSAGLIVMGSRGRGGIRRALMGSVSDSVVRHAHCPVMVTRH